MNQTEMKELRGLPCKVETPSWIKNGYVAHVDRTKGITVHDENDKPLLCVNKKDYESLNYRDWVKLYHERFTQVVEEIKNGHIVAKSIVSRGNGEYGVYQGTFYGGEMSKCAYR